jgi:hypothetical protein
MPFPHGQLRGARRTGNAAGFGSTPKSAKKAPLPSHRPCPADRKEKLYPVYPPLSTSWSVPPEPGAHQEKGARGSETPGSTTAKWPGSTKSGAGSRVSLMSAGSVTSLAGVPPSATV